MFNLLAWREEEGSLPVVDVVDVVVDSHPLSSVLEMMSFTTNIHVQDVSRLKVFRCKTRIEESKLKQRALLLYCLSGSTTLLCWLDTSWL